MITATTAPIRNSLKIAKTKMPKIVIKVNVECKKLDIVLQHLCFNFT